MQGTAEPTAGLVSQPVRSLLRSWGQNAEQIAAAMLLISMPWNIKPLFGLLTDFVPLFGYRRKSYFILSSLVTLVGMLGAALLPLPEGARTLLIVLLFLPSVGIAFTDVVTDAYMVDTGQPLGITGRLQSAQWGAIYAAGLITGVVGGYLSEHSLQRVGFLICGLLSTVTLYLAIFQVKEKPVHRREPGQLRQALRALFGAFRNRRLLIVAGFLLLINFNPFSADVLYIHMTEVLGFREQFVGTTYTISSAASIVAAVLYGIYSPRVSVKVLVHGSIILMILASLVYLGLGDTRSAVLISIAFGFIYMTTGLIQLDLAARYCPRAVAGTVFAALMSLMNLSISFSSVLGGRFYTRWMESLGPETAFSIMVVVGALFTAACWILYYLFPMDREAGAAS